MSPSVGIRTGLLLLSADFAVALWQSPRAAQPHLNAAAQRAPAIQCALRDDFVLQGDAAVLMGYGFVQGAVDISFAPMAQTQPELFDLLVGQPVQLPSLQGVVLAALWIGTGLILRSTDERVDPFDVKKTRGVEPVTAAANVVAPWVTTVLPMVVVLASLSASFALGPGLPQEEMDFLVGAYVVVAGWRVIGASLLPII
jgi:hypothetical protein